MRFSHAGAMLGAVLVLAGCGGASGPVPDVVGKRLDVAKSTMKETGYDTEEIGGGTFGVLNESNWTVCETDPPAGTTSSGKVKLIVDRTCSATASSASGTSDAAETATPEPTRTEEPTPEPTPKPKKKRRKPRPTVTAITVPDVVGMDHQAAQDRMQAVGLYNLRERDATGQGRMLVWDRNWVVVRQSPPPGAAATETTEVTLYSVKDGER